ncbi:hypothetical protein SEA_TRAAWW1_2 [Mycobacterium phage Traaww1]|nr:hypothetical protein SEA_ASRIEL_2 [Mycobacterium phage Asriel]AVI03393.1 hypothetical protein SEA_BARBARIAN_2 [Mycobacterium phage Barbarian]QGJ91824.1 hypothetical protein SEA_TRAAWW1_2 [Mycobacterium phage Traaww1]
MKLSDLPAGTVVTKTQAEALGNPEFEGCTVMGAIREDEPAVKTWGKSGTVPWGTVSWPVDDEELRWASNLAEFVGRRLSEILGVKLDPGVFCGNRAEASLNDRRKLQ